MDGGLSRCCRDADACGLFSYLHCMYLASKTATSIGNNAVPTIQVEYMFMTFYWLLGIFVFAMLIGQVSRLVEC